MSRTGIPVLYVASDSARAESVASELEALRDDLRVYTTTTVGDAFDRLRPSTDVECVVSDADLATLDGVTFLQMLRAVQPTLPFILYADDRDRDDAERAFSADVTEYVVDSIDGDTVPTLATLVGESVESRAVRDRLVQSEARAKSLLEASPDMAAIVRDGRYVYVNSAGLRLLGAQSPEDVCGRSVLDFVHPRYHDEVTRHLGGVQAGNRVVYRAPRELVGLDGRVTPVEVSETSIEWEGVPATIVIARDQTRVQRRERALHRAETVVQMVEDAVWVIDTHQQLTFVNDALTSTLGCDAEDVLDNAIADVLRSKQLLDDDEVDAVTRELDAVIAGEMPMAELELEFSLGDQSMYSDVHVVPLRIDGDVVGAVGVNRDITTLKRHEEQLLEEIRYRSDVLDAFEDIFYVHTSEGDILETNRAAVEITGYSESELEAMQIFDLFDAEYEAALRTLLQQTLERGHVTEEIPLRTKDGTEIPYEFRSSTIELPDGTCVITGVGRDISVRVERERQLHVLDRVLRHNLRNDMAVVLGFADDIRGHEDEEVAEAARTIYERGERLLDTATKERAIVDVLAANREPTTLDVAAHTRRTATRIREQHPDATISLDVPASANALALPEIEVAIAELLENAIEHSGDGPVAVTVDVERRGESVRIRVADNGPGIPEREYQVLTRGREIGPLYHGSGMGLWLVHWVVMLSGGTVTFEENDPHGSVVVVDLPVAGTND